MPLSFLVIYLSFGWAKGGEFERSPRRDPPIHHLIIARLLIVDKYTIWRLGDGPNRRARSTFARAAADHLLAELPSGGHVQHRRRSPATLLSQWGRWAFRGARDGDSAIG
jgi:hypothetical protein